MCFRDQIVQRSYSDVIIYPSMSASWIYDNYACQDSKGTDFARARVKEHLRRFYRRHGTAGWILKVDIRKYYDSMLFDVIIDNFYRKCPEWAARFAANTILQQYNLGDDIGGVNPGSQLVQIAGIEYLDSLDHFLKEQCKVKHYGRYMDDFFIFDSDYERLVMIQRAIEEHIAPIGLMLHPDKTTIIPITSMFRFLGFDFRLTETGKVIMTLAPESVRSTKRKLRKLYALENDRYRPRGTTDTSYAGWRNHASKGHSQQLLFNMDEWYATIKEP